MGQKFPTTLVLELACAAQRVNNAYIKDSQSVYDDNGKFLYVQHTNKALILQTLIPDQNITANEFQPQRLSIEPNDRVQAEEIKKYFRKLIFSAIKGDNEFHTEVNSLLNEEDISVNKIGYIACLPSSYIRDISESAIKRKLKDCDDTYLADTNVTLKDLDADIIESRRSNNFDAWNICAIINKRLVTWFSKTNLNLGPCVIVKAKVKEHRTHWKYKKSETRLNYVKAVQ